MARTSIVVISLLDRFCGEGLIEDFHHQPTLWWQLQEQLLWIAAHCLFSYHYSKHPSLSICTCAAPHKLRFQVCIMRMRMTCECDKKSKTQNQYRSALIYLCECESEVRWRQNESLHVAIGPNVNGLSDRKSLHMHGHHSVAHTSCRGKVHWSLNIIHIRHHIGITHKWNLSFSHGQR